MCLSHRSSWGCILPALWFDPFEGNPKHYSLFLTTHKPLTNQKHFLHAQVFNAEHQANCCGFLDPTNSCPSVYAFDSMRTHFNAWPLNTTASDETVEEPSPAWRQLKTPKRARALLAARLIDPSPLRVCLLSSWAVKADVRLSLVTPTKADVVKNRHLIKRAREVAPDLECDAVYARFMGVGVQDKEGKQKLDVVVVGRHSVNRFQARV